MSLENVKLLSFLFLNPGPVSARLEVRVGCVCNGTLFGDADWFSSGSSWTTFNILSQRRNKGEDKGSEIWSCDSKYPPKVQFLKRKKQISKLKQQQNQS